jgi:hypothetical protein
VIVIERDGKTIVITGWRAWVIGAVAVVVMIAVLAALAFLVLGIAVSMVAFLLIVAPAVAIVVLMAWFFPTAKRVTRCWGPWPSGYDLEIGDIRF